MKNFLKLNWLKLLLVFVVIGLDLLTKEIFYLTDFTIIPFLISTRTVEGLNYGGAFSLLNQNPWLILVLSIVFIVIICIYDVFAKETSKVYSISLGFIVGGAIGNIIDRIFLGGVRDFICFEFWQDFATFNVADSFLFVGTVLLVIYTIFIYKPKEREKK